MSGNLLFNVQNHSFLSGLQEFHSIGEWNFHSFTFREYKCAKTDLIFFSSLTGKYEKKSKKGSLRSSLFKSNASYANEAYVNDGQTRPNGAAASLDRRSVGSAESATAADVRPRPSSRNSSAHTGTEGRATPSNTGSLGKQSRGRGDSDEPDYASVKPRSQRGDSNGSAVMNDDTVSHHSTRSARSAQSAHSAHSSRSGKSGSRAHDVVM